MTITYTERSVNISATRITGYFYSDAVFNLSNTVHTNIEIKVLEKGLDFAPTQIKLNEPELRQDFAEFYRPMRTKWFFRNELTPQFSEVLLFLLSPLGNLQQVIPTWKYF